MNDPHTDTANDFLVKESRSINYIAGGFLIAVFFVSLLFGSYDLSNYLFGVCILLLPGAIAIARGRRNRVIMKINKNGIYYAGQMVTNWTLYYDAVVADKRDAASFRDNFVLDLRYYSPDYSLMHTRSIPLTNSQDKSEEEIIQAIRLYYNAARLNAAGRPTATDHPKS